MRGANPRGGEALKSEGEERKVKPRLKEKFLVTVFTLFGGKKETFFL
jgi:hypothetical protein